MVGGFLAEVEQLRRGRLHAEGHLVASDARGDLRVAGALLMQLVEIAQHIEPRALRGGADAAADG